MSHRQVRPLDTSPPASRRTGGDLCPGSPGRVASGDVHRYSLGVSDVEMRRLDVQADRIAAATALLLRSAGIASGMRILDLGTGLGRVAFQLGELVGPAGAVLGIDQAEAMLEVAEERRAAAGVENVRFIQADVRTFRDQERFDAVVGRLILFHLPGAVDVLRHHLESVTSDGRMVMIDFDSGTVRTNPPVALWDTGTHWILQAFASGGADPMVGSRLGALLEEAGLTDIEIFGIQSYLAPDDPYAAEFLAGVATSLAPVITGAGIATSQQLGLPTLRQRLANEIRRSRATALPPALVGAWGRPRS